MPKKIADPVQYPLTGIWSDALKQAYDELKMQYGQEGRPQVYLNSLRKARLALTRHAPPHQINGWTWLVGSTRNHQAAARNEQPVGYRCIPSRGRCACQDGRLKYDTCTHQEIVALYLLAKRYNEQLRGPAQSSGLPGLRGGPAATAAPTLHTVARLAN